MKVEWLGLDGVLWLVGQLRANVGLHVNSGSTSIIIETFADNNA